MKQLTVFVQNQKGSVVSVTDILSASGINLRALSIAETEDFGILRLVVSDTEAAERALRERGYLIKTVDVIGVKIGDAPGKLSEALGVLDRADINVEYLYASVGRSGKAIMIVRVDDDENAERVLHDGGFHDVHPSEIYRI
jgi:hypothetical protein